MHPVDPEMLDRIKQTVAKTIADAMGNDGLALASKVIENIDTALADPLDPRPFVPGRRVSIHGINRHGTVARVVEQGGEVHTVVVIIDGVPGQRPMSPRELEVIAP